MIMYRSWRCRLVVVLSVLNIGAYCAGFEWEITDPPDLAERDFASNLFTEGTAEGEYDDYTVRVIDDQFDTLASESGTTENHTWSNELSPPAIPGTWPQEQATVRLYDGGLNQKDSKLVQFTNPE
jgi:hypothetical protein